MTDLERRGENFLLQARVNGRQKYTSVIFDLRGGEPVHLHTDLVNLSSQRVRKQFVSVVPDEFRAEVDALATELAHEAAEVQQRAPDKSPVATAAPALEPWPEPVVANEVLAEVTTVLRERVVLRQDALNALGLWVLHTYVTDVTDYTPYIWVHSASRECGKSTVLELLLHLANAAQLNSGITAAALYRRIDRVRPLTMLMDETDTRLLGDGGEVLRGVLNSGFKRTGVITLCVGENHDERDFSTFCPKVLAGIGRLWDTVQSRSIPIRMERASKDELRNLQKIRGDTIDELCRPIRRKALRWALDSTPALRDADPECPDEMGARQSDVWRPLFAIADSISDECAADARKAALVLHRGHEETDVGLLMLEDVRDLLDAKEGATAIYTETLLDSLTKREDRPWCEYQRGGKPITARGIAKLLGRFDVKPKTVRAGLTTGGQETGKGYSEADLGPVFKRYLPEKREKEGRHPPPKTSQASQSGSGPAVVTDVTDTEGGVGPLFSLDYEAEERAAIQAEGAE